MYIYNLSVFTVTNSIAYEFNKFTASITDMDLKKNLSLNLMSSRYVRKRIFRILYDPEISLPF